MLVFTHFDLLTSWSYILIPYPVSPMYSPEYGAILFSQLFHKGENKHLKQVSKAEFAWLYHKYFRKFKYKNWIKTCVAKGRSKRGKYYVEDKWYERVKQQKIV